jgi:hypothetical protein
MGDITRGETFADGEEVNAARLHKLVDNALLNAGVVKTSNIADGAVTGPKIAADVTLQTGQVLLPEGTLLIGGPAGKGIPITPGPEMTVGSTFGIADGGVTTAKIAEGGVTAGKLALVTPTSAGTFGSASKIPVVTVDNKGRVTAASEVGINTVGMVQILDLAPQSMPWSPGLRCVWANTLGGKPHFLNIWVECVLDTLDTGNPSTEPNAKVGDRFLIQNFFFRSGADTWPAYSINAYKNGSGAEEIEVVASGDGGILVMLAHFTARHVIISGGIPPLTDNFRMRGYALRVL